MILQLNSNRRIVGTDRAWELQRIRVSRGRSEWRPYKYFHSLGAAVQEAASSEIRTSAANGLVEALDAVRRVTERYDNLIDNAAREIANRGQRKLRVA